MDGIQSRTNFSKIIIYLILIAGAFVMVAPFAYMLATSFKPQAYILTLPPQFIPQEPTVKNFVEAWTTYNFGRAFLNSLIVATATTSLVIFLSSMMAFAFARFDFPGKKFFFWLLLSSLMVPPILLLIPQFMLARILNLLNSLWGLVVFYTTINLAFITFLLRSFMETLPKELEESARIDGAGLFTIYAKIIMPLSKPGLAVASIFTFLMAWDEFVIALTFLQDSEKYTLPIAIALFQGRHLTQWGLVFAGTTIAILPVIIMFAIFQRQIIGGISTTGFK